MRKIKYTAILNVFDGNIVRTKEIADACGIKQPFEFVKSMRMAGVKILKDKDTQEFRDKNLDSSRTTFVKVSDFLAFAKKHQELMYNIAPHFGRVKQMLEVKNGCTNR